MVEQRTENPRGPSSMLGGATIANQGPGRTGRVLFLFDGRDTGGAYFFAFFVSSMVSLPKLVGRSLLPGVVNSISISFFSSPMKRRIPISDFPFSQAMSI